VKYETLRHFALALPGSEEQPHFDMASFRVKKRIYVTVPPGAESIHVFGAEAERERALAMYPEWTEKLLWGGKVAGLRILLAEAPPAAVKSIVEAAWAFKGGRR
jgi:hypothetical protein